MFSHVVDALPDLRRFLSGVAEPVQQEKVERTRAVWQSFSQELKVPHQVLGRQHAGCAATYGVMERCDFSCVACYLSNRANKTPPLPFEEVRAQLDTIRGWLGPWGKTQITAGEVTLLPVEQLVRIIRYCHEIELCPMVMSHGQTFLRDPGYLRTLVRDGGLDRISLHIDTTQRGRDGMNIGDREHQIHWIRDRFAELIRQTRRETGKPLHAAHTFTVTAENFEQVPTVMRWLTRNVDAFRMISFQPTAAVGRTRTGEQINRREALWNGICEGLGTRINRQSMLFGHPDCTTIALVWVVRFDGRQVVVDVTREGKAVDQQFFQRFLERFAGFSPDGEPVSLWTGRLAGRILRRPGLLFESLAYCGYRAFTERAWLPAFLSSVIRGGSWSVRPLAIVIHNFMSAHELESDEGRARLDSCAFRVPIDGEMVSMCRLNGTPLRQRINESDRLRLSLPRRAGG